MEVVLVERRFDQPVTFEHIAALEDAGSWCLQVHGVRFLKTFFSRDRRRMLCLYEAPDAEAVRLAETEAKVPYERAWTCTNVPGTDFIDQTRVTEYVVAERLFSEPVTREFISNTLRSGHSCLDLHRAQHVESYLGSDGLRMVCIFRAPDAEAVRRAHASGNVDFTAIWTASVHLAGRDSSALS